MAFLGGAGELPDLLDSLRERLAAKAGDDLRARSSRSEIVSSKTSAAASASRKPAVSITGAL